MRCGSTLAEFSSSRSDLLGVAILPPENLCFSMARNIEILTIMPSIREARLRHASYYMNVLRAADDFYRQGGASSTRGLQLFNGEWTNIQVAQERLAEYSDLDETADGYCSEYPRGGSYLLNLRQYPRDRIRWLNSALAAARRL